MAQAPMPMPGDAGGDPMGAGPTAPDDSSTTTLVTICKTGDGSYVVYQGDEPSGDDSDTSGDDADAMGGAGAPPAAHPPAQQGQPADSIGMALKLALGILQDDASSEGAPGNADSQFAAGFSADKNPTPAGGVAQKY